MNDNRIGSATKSASSSDRFPIRWCYAVIVLLLGLTASASISSAQTPSPRTEGPSTPTFNRDIKPLLSDRCFQCHGPDAGHRHADLRLDVREAAIEYAIVPEHPDESVLIDRLLEEDPDLRMPPADSKKPPLSEAEIELIRRWIEQGANYEEHWSYAPRSQDNSSENIQNASIDGFVRTKLNEVGLTLNQQADPRTLIRRLAFDLTGLPPTEEQVAAFVDDPSDAAYEKLVEEFLASPAFGERMAVYWLDLVRYADTNGIHGDNHRDHDLFRDYVIRSFNDNLPFDQFTREQLAGDLLNEPDDWQIIASGYNRLNMTTREGGAQPKEYIAKYAADRVRNATTVWLGSTVGCAECHDHKYDPFTQEDFYRFAAFFADIEETAVGQQTPTQMATPEQKKLAAELRQRLTQTHQQLKQKSESLRSEFDAWVQAERSSWQQHEKRWNRSLNETCLSENGAKYSRLPDGSWLASGANPDQDVITLTLTSKKPQQVNAIRLETLTHSSLAGGKLSRANGNFVLSQLQIESDGQPLEIKSAVADFEQDGWPVTKTLDGNNATGWAVNGHGDPRDHQALFTLAKPVTITPEKPLVIRLVHGSPHLKHVIGRLRLSTTSESNATLPNEYDAAFTSLLELPLDQQTPEQRRALLDRFTKTTPLLAEDRAQVDSLREELKRLEESYRPILVTKRREPLPVRVLPRGNWLDESNDPILPSTPHFLPELKSADDRRATRLDLAEWLVDPQNPLVARVAVNRFWMLLFGEGIVRTPDDFGSQGNVPTHPELLDWLAGEFVASGWDVKQMMRQIVSSRTYQQDSFASAQLRAADPTNRWLARQNRFRLAAEFIRDNALTASQLIEHHVGGPSVKPYQPSGYWSHLNFPQRTYQEDAGAAQYRRGLYTYWCRTFLHPSLLAFDAPSREECTVQRNRSNTPLQALVLLNDPTYVEAARRVAELAIRQSPNDDRQRFDFIYQRILQRLPRDEERLVLQELLDDARQEFKDASDQAEKLLAIGQAQLLDSSREASIEEVAAWTQISRAVMNLHESITRY